MNLPITSDRLAAPASGPSGGWRISFERNRSRSRSGAPHFKLQLVFGPARRPGTLEAVRRTWLPVLDSGVADGHAQGLRESWAGGRSERRLGGRLCRTNPIYTVPSQFGPIRPTRAGSVVRNEPNPHRSSPVRVNRRSGREVGCAERTQSGERFPPDGRSILRNEPNLHHPLLPPAGLPARSRQGGHEIGLSCLGTAKPCHSLPKPPGLPPARRPILPTEPNSRRRSAFRQCDGPRRPARGSILPNEADSDGRTRSSVGCAGTGPETDGHPEKNPVAREPDRSRNGDRVARQLDEERTARTELVAEPRERGVRPGVGRDDHGVVGRVDGSRHPDA
ncbi:MAG: hypothetical protein JWO38_7756 [Gemmataceae bacterium]|nr:hypothetical protein [Gemmataceae bacterium]